MRKIALLPLALLAGAAAPAMAVPIDAVDLDGFPIGATIVGPVGPTVEVSLAADGVAYGDLTGSVSCPVGFDTCAPPQNPAGTIYTYQHVVVSGVDLPNDPPFPAPGGDVLSLDGITDFSLGFNASGFNGVAGYSFDQAEETLGTADSIRIESNDDGSISWLIGGAGNWDTGEAITFFWQTTQPPSGPGGVYTLSNGAINASGNGPVPTAVVAPPTPTPVSGPAGLGGLIVAFVGLLGLRAARR